MNLLSSPSHPSLREVISACYANVEPKDQSSSTFICNFSHNSAANSRAEVSVFCIAVFQIQESDTGIFSAALLGHLLRFGLEISELGIGGVLRHQHVCHPSGAKHWVPLLPRTQRRHLKGMLQGYELFLVFIKVHPDRYLGTMVIQALIQALSVNSREWSILQRRRVFCPWWTHSALTSWELPS